MVGSMDCIHNGGMKKHLKGRKVYILKLYYTYLNVDTLHYRIWGDGRPIHVSIAGYIARALFDFHHRSHKDVSLRVGAGR